MQQHADEYLTRPQLVKDFIHAFFEERWNGATDCEFTVLSGGHEVNCMALESLKKS
jgi:hypothetical protein